MHILIVIGAGVALLLSCALLGHAWGSGMPGVAGGAKAFIPLWFALAFVNMWVGTTHGYSWAEEAPIFLGILAAPAVVAALRWRKIA